ncbi:MAG: TIGR00297 family protein [Oscillatoriophycideae cyanobacterium NC_groundwater_1537_Pr4_S-0.65um_50_18]|nr:TIGR00297 family protein [Oscillatoriophycideae cyanobacterium NC_groundwater_1537_Pr4_S-0.65um_50_18]
MLNSLDSLVALDIVIPWAFAIGLNAILVAIAWFAPKKLLTPAGLVHAGILGIILWGTLGWRGYSVMMFYFLVGSAVTRIGMKQKEAAGIAEKRSGARGPENVWGSALTATLCALGAYGLASAPFPWSRQVIFLLLLGYVASISTKLSDTCASEVGKAYGKRTFLITTLKPVERGTEGAVSLEGTLAGIVGSAALAIVGWLVGLITPMDILWCLIAAFIATNLESVIGATLQSKFDWLTNEVVNIFNTLMGAIAAIALALAFQAVT